MWGEREQTINSAVQIKISIIGAVAAYYQLIQDHRILFIDLAWRHDGRRGKR
jgi:hypothetical protein